MNAIRKQKLSFKSKPIAITSLMIALTVIGGVTFLLMHGNTQASPESTFKPAFSFDALKASGWWTNGSANPADGLTKDYIGNPDDLPVADIAIHHGQRDAPGDCFVSYAYYDRDIDLATALKQKEARVVEHSDSLSLEKISTQSLSIGTPDGAKEYSLHQYNLTGPSEDALMRGIEFGYLQLEHGYVEISGNCNTSDQLPSTIPPLEATALHNSAPLTK